jgi:hypothetical protein
VHSARAIKLTNIKTKCKAINTAAKQLTSYCTSSAFY